MNKVRSITVCECAVWRVVDQLLRTTTTIDSELVGVAVRSQRKSVRALGGRPVIGPPLSPALALLLRGAGDE